MTHSPYTPRVDRQNYYDSYCIWHHSTIITGSSKSLARPTPFIFHSCARTMRKNVTTCLPHTPELEFRKEMIRGSVFLVLSRNASYDSPMLRKVILRDSAL
jgi:hypothetical protein